MNYMSNKTINNSERLQVPQTPQQHTKTLMLFPSATGVSDYVTVEQDPAYSPIIDAINQLANGDTITRAQHKLLKKDAKLHRVLLNNRSHRQQNNIEKIIEYSKGRIQDKEPPNADNDTIY